MAKPTKYKVRMRFAPRIIHEHLGRAKYTSSVQAIGELVANALHADATRVDIDVIDNQLSGVDRIVVSDDGSGMTRDDIETRFGLVGVDPVPATGSKVRFSRFGIGRLAVFRIGSLSTWTTYARDGDKVFKNSFTLNDAGNVEELDVEQEEVSVKQPTGTTVTIYNIIDKPSAPTAAQIESGILSQFCSYILSNPTVNIRVQGEPVVVDRLIDDLETEDVSVDGSTSAIVKHILLRKDVDESRFSARLMFCALGRTVASDNINKPPSSRYICIVECPYLDKIVSSNREDLIEFDGTFARLRDRVLTSVRDFGKRLSDRSADRFLADARQESYYPYRSASEDPVIQIQQAQFDHVLVALHERVNLGALTRKYQEVIFNLLNRAIKNDNVLDVLREVVKLSDSDMKQFRDVLERTSLESVVHLASTVTDRMEFLNVLHKLVYDENAKHVRERTQLHLVVEQYCWIFGSQYNLATSDQSFRSVLKKHREDAGLPPLVDVDAEAISGIGDIPDLFLCASKGFADAPQRRHLVVEIKAPAVKVGRKQIEEIRDYGTTIAESGQFDKANTHWDLYIVSAGVQPEAERYRRQANLPFGLLHPWPGMNLWCFTWSELIERARVEMVFALEHLKAKSEELRAYDYIRKYHPDVFSEMHRPRIRKASAPEANKQAPAAAIDDSGK